MITFKEYTDRAGYAARTGVNIANSDLTIIFAEDFTSPGTALTKTLCKNLGKKYCSVNIAYLGDVTFRAGKIVEWINNYCGNQLVVNIAGNNISKLSKEQHIYDLFIWNLFVEIMADPYRLFNITLSVGGGQTGVDEAGAKAMSKLLIPTEILAPKGWMFRDKSGKDIQNEELFKQRFINAT